MTPPPKLHVHRNTEWQRERKQISERLIAEARTIAGQKAVAGFVIVAWNNSGETTVAADLEADVIPTRAVPAYVMQELQDRLFRKDD